MVDEINESQQLLRDAVLPATKQNITAAVLNRRIATI